MPGEQRHVVAVFNSSVETLEVLRDLLTEDGFFPVTAHVDDVRLGKVDLLEFVRVHEPAVIVWDIAPPYAENFRLLRLIRAVPAIDRVPFVVTSTNARALQEMTGQESHEIVGKPFDLRQLVEAIRSRLPS